MDGGDMSHLLDIPPWSELLRACSAGKLNQCLFGMQMKLKARKEDPRTVDLMLLSGNESLHLPSAFVCLCGAFLLGARSEIAIDDLATSTGARRAAELLCGAMRKLRPTLENAPDAMLRTVAGQLHADLVKQLAVHACKWNLPPYSLLGRSHAKPSECWHRVNVERS
jgi:hypothetical protein